MANALLIAVFIFVGMWAFFLYCLFCECGGDIGRFKYWLTFWLYCFFTCGFYAPTHPDYNPSLEDSGLSTNRNNRQVVQNATHFPDHQPYSNNIQIVTRNPAHQPNQQAQLQQQMNTMQIQMQQLMQQNAQLMQQQNANAIAVGGAPMTSNAVYGVNPNNSFGVAPSYSHGPPPTNYTHVPPPNGPPPPTGTRIHYANKTHATS